MSAQGARTKWSQIYRPLRGKGSHSPCFLPPSLLLPPLIHATHSNPVITTNLRIIIKNYLRSLCLQKNYNFYAGLASCNFSELKWFWGAEHKICCTARSGTLQLRKGALSMQWWWASNWPQFVWQNHKPSYHMNCRYHETVKLPYHQIVHLQQTQFVCMWVGVLIVLCVSPFFLWNIFNTLSC